MGPKLSAHLTNTPRRGTEIQTFQLEGSNVHHLHYMPENQSASEQIDRDKSNMANSEPLLRQWFPHTINPFIANAPMFGSADYHLATAVTKAGGLGKLKLMICIYVLYH